MATLIPADARLPLREIEAKNGRRGFQLKELYALLGCTMVEVVPLAGGVQIMIIDEEGKLIDKPRNDRATELAQFATPAQLTAWLLNLRNQGVAVIRVSPDHIDVPEYIVGDVLICDNKDLH
jgi:hypothetical protein